MIWAARLLIGVAGFSRRMIYWNLLSWGELPKAWGLLCSFLLNIIREVLSGL